MSHFKKLTTLFLLSAVLYGGPGRLIPPSKDVQYSRPSGLDQTYISPSGRFALHYTKTGSDTVPQVYTHDLNTPDYILNAAAYLETGYLLLTGPLGLPTPPEDDVRNPEIDVYFRRLNNGVYGQTTAEQHKPLSGRQRAYTAYSEIHHTLTGSSFYTEGDDALKVTCVHELFHIFQVGIGIWDLNEDMWFYETSATWIEEYAYPDVNDYFQYVERYLSNWGDPLCDYIYDNVTWLIYLNNKNDGKAVGDIWNAMKTRSAWPAITDYLTEKNGKNPWAKNLAAWGMEHLYAGDGAPELSFFEDGASYSPVTFNPGTFISYSGRDTLTVTLDAEPFSSSFYKIKDISASRLKVRILSPGAVAGKAWTAGSMTPSVDLSHVYTSIGSLSGPWDLLISLGTDDAYTSDSPLRITLEVRKDDTKLIALYPNPVSNPHQLTISYNLQDDINRGDITIYDIRGRQLNRVDLSGKDRMSGLHKLSYGLPKNISSGIYILVLKAGNEPFAEKFTVLK
jgi:hypothetical protein